MLYVGLDLHKEKVYAAVMDEKGTIVKEESFRNKKEDFTQFFQGINKAQIAMEAIGFCHPTYDLLKSMGYDVSVAHPLKTRIIGEAKIKTDKIDSKVLAHLLRSDLLPTSYVPEKQVRALRDIVRQRAFLVRMRNRMKNKIHAELSKRWINPEVPDIFTKAGKTVLRDLHIDAVNTYLNLADVLEEQINDVTQRIESIAREHDDVKLLMTIPGIGYYSALLIYSEIGDINRFTNSHKLCSYAGLIPSTRQSGNTTFHGHITKQGSKWLRWILIQCTYVHVKYDTHLTRFYHKLARKKGKKVAVVATANKLLRVMYQMLKNKEPFQPFKINNTSGTSCRNL